MSIAIECDLCGKLLAKHEAIGTIRLEVSKQINAEGHCASWSDVDFCDECTPKVLELIKPALLDFDAPQSDDVEGAA